MGLRGSLQFKSQPSKIRTGLRDDLTHMGQAATRRSMSNGRLISTALSLLLALFTSYASFFYFPAYVSGSSILKVSSQSAHYPSSSNHKPNQTILERYINHLIMNRGYLTAGQAVTARYARSAETDMTLVMSHCSGIIVLEIFSCESVDVNKLKAKKINGEIQFTVPKNGFYRFKEVTTSEGIAPPDFDVIWSRS